MFKKKKASNICFYALLNDFIVCSHFCLYDPLPYIISEENLIFIIKKIDFELKIKIIYFI